MRASVCVRPCARVRVCVHMYSLTAKNQGNAGGVYLKEIAGMQLLDLA